MCELVLFSTNVTLINWRCVSFTFFSPACCGGVNTPRAQMEKRGCDTPRFLTESADMGMAMGGSMGESMGESMGGSMGDSMGEKFKCFDGSYRPKY